MIYLCMTKRMHRNIPLKDNAEEMLIFIINDI